MANEFEKRNRSKRISRRTFIKASAGTAALLAAVKTQFPFGVGDRASRRSRK